MYPNYFCNQACRPTLGPKLALTRPNSLLEIMCKFPYLALTLLNSHYLAQSRGEFRSQSRPACYP